MTLSEKIFALRSEAGLSQGDLAEKLEVSRQSVSKWETGQSVPDLDKIIKLADLFGVSVDELVRDGASPFQKPEHPAAPSAPPPSPLPVNLIVGVLLEIMGSFLFFLGLVGGAGLMLAGVFLVSMGLPFLLAKKYPWLIAGWLLLLWSYLVFNPWMSSVPLLWAVAQEFLAGQALQPDSAFALARAAALPAMILVTVRARRREQNKKGTV